MKKLFKNGLYQLRRWLTLVGIETDLIVGTKLLSIGYFKARWW